MKKKPFTISTSHLANANTYMPIEDKIRYSHIIAQASMEDAGIDPQNEDGEKILPLPELKEENSAMKKMLLMQLFLEHYLNIEIPEMTAELYDYYAGNHLFNQIERFKSTADLRDRAFDILSDFRDFKKMVDTEIFNIRSRANDTLSRFTASMQIYATPENIEKMKSEFERISLSKKQEGN